MAGGWKTLAGAPLLVLAACGGGGSSAPSGGGTGSGPPTPPPPPPPAAGNVYSVPAAESLSAAEVGQVIAQAAAQASAQGDVATIAVVDRVGNVLGVFQMPGAAATVRIDAAPDGNNIDAQGLDVPSTAAAIAKAITGAYLSSGGNAFSSRTASMIVQEHFPPAPTTVGLESGPLFGVQFSQLPCSDLVARASDGMIGPQRSPLGLAADPGGFPLYKNGVVVGGVGVMADGRYSADLNVLDVDNDIDEAIALAGTVGFEAPQSIRADRIFADGTALRYTDATYAQLASVSSASFAGTAGGLIAVNGYHPGTSLSAGTVYGSEASGIRPTRAAEFAISDAFVLSNGAGVNRFPVRAGTDGADIAAPISADEARTILEEAFTVMSRARAQIRQPLDSRAQVTISLVDTRGRVLGIVRSPDAPIFGTDVSLQKARTASFFSGAFAANELLAAQGEVPQFVQRVRDFLGDQNALTGAFAFADRSGGNLSRPYFPDGEVGTPHGPLSRPIQQFNPFSTGLQSALIIGNVGQHLGFVQGANADTPANCTTLPQINPGESRLDNGIQIFPGSVPVYRGNQLVGGIGVSGDGIDQDDMISFLGLHNAGQSVGGIGNAPADIRADRIIVQVGSRQVRLRYVNCPFAPFLDTPDQNVCEGL